jgi:peptidoglycan-associated lipoprotein
MKNVILLSMLIGGGMISAVAQPLNRPTYAMMINTAEEQMEKKDYYRALEWYEKAYEESKDRELAIIIADLNYMLRDYGDAERWYSRALRPSKKVKDVPEEKRFEYARSLKMTGKYDEAIEQFDSFIKKTSDPVRKEIAELEKIGCEFARVAKQQDGLTITNAGKEVNTKTSEYSPFITNDLKELYFTSFQTDDVIEVDEKNADGYQAKIYKSTRTDKGWAKAEALDDNVNRPGFHTANVTLSPDHKHMFITRELLEGHLLKESKIYMSESSGSGWSPPQEVAGVNGNFIAKSPSVGELFGKEVLFFVSNMDGGTGGYDIYYATYKGNGQYGDPVNLGPKINTIADEETPFYRDGTLYFSSNGHPGLGGYDIFMSTWNGVMWSKPANMGKGYNSPVDDLFFMLDKEGYHGMLASNRDAEGSRSVKGKTCCNDLYNVSLKKIVADLIATTFDAETKQPLSGVTLELIDLKVGGSKVVDTKTNEGGNNFDFPLELDKSYMIIGSADNYERDTVTFNTVGLFDSKTYQEKLYLKPGRKTITIRREEPFLLENILYEFDDDKILPVAEPDLQLVLDLMKQYPDMVIELSSHTDARGTDQYNRDLSQRRAESARRWLTTRSVERKRIEAKGYGESAPKTVDARTAAKFPFLKTGDVLTEEFINAFLPDSTKFENAHFVNRRTEFKIIAGPTSIVIEEEKLIQIGNRKVDGEEPKKEEKKETPKKNVPNKKRDNTPTPSPGGDSLKPTPNAKLLKLAADSVKIHPYSSLYGKKNLKGLPIMHFDERMVDFGKVTKGEKRVHTYTFTNLGSVPLEIDIASGCECTTTDYTRTPVPPGGKGTVKVTFDSTEKEASETVDVDIYLKNIDPELDAPIFERVQFVYELVK